MTLSFAGIENVEFYSGHYLDSVLEGDLKAQFDVWVAAEREHGTRPPWKALDALANRWFQQSRAAADEADPQARLRHARAFHAELLQALGYGYAPELIDLDEDTHLPVLATATRDQRPFLWVLEAAFPPPRAEDHDPLDETPRHPDNQDVVFQARLPKQTFRELLDDTLFRQDVIPGGGPRWVLFLSGDEALLTERNKWLQGRLLRFSWKELFTRRDSGALKAVCGLLHRDVLAPDSGLCLHDTLDENSHKHAFAVSGDLKHGIRRALELLANEAVWYRRENRKAVFSNEDFANKLREESLTWLYRLLFLFYVEARSEELQTVPMRSETYRKGYSLETLRDLELVPLHTEKAQNGYFLHDSLQTLFKIVQQGFPAVSLDGQRGLFGFHVDAAVDAHGMRVTGLHSPLFDDARLDALAGVRFRNKVLQEVLQLLSLSKEQRGRRSQRGRISYAQLGINQLGAVYESLLSYSGFFAQEDLYEVSKAGENQIEAGSSREDLQSWFVPASRIGDYEDDEIVRDEHGRKVVHPKGAFLFRLAGRHREKSASYYTPEVLTRCLVKYSLKELLWESKDDGSRGAPKFSAKEILALTVCEPAMGSGAFLLEAVDQLADAYLERAQQERGEAIPSGEYQEHKRRVRARLATNYCHGIDLNPVAVELGKVSLWLGTIYQGGKCPWFGLRLAVGNSLVGARRQVFKTSDVVRKGSKENPNWLGLVPDAVPMFGAAAPQLGARGWALPVRPKGSVYHFLLPADGMAPFDGDRVIKELVPDPVAAIKKWRTEFCKPFDKQDGARLEKLSDAVDRLWAEVCRERALAISESSDRVPVWGEDGWDKPRAAGLEVQDQEAVAQALESTSSAYRRLKLVMDAWCALWFWPLDRVEQLPTREVWLRTLELVLLGQVDAKVAYAQGGLWTGKGAAQGALALDSKRGATVAVDVAATGERLTQLKALSAAFEARRREGAEECGLADVAEVVESSEMLRVVEAVAERLRFHHWELRFAEVFAGRGGFDLILGNPPWIKLQWNESGVLGDGEPRLVIRSMGAPEVARRRQELFGSGGAIRAAYLEEFADMQGAQAFLNAEQNYALLKGVQTNLYKCFLAGALWQVSSRGIAGLIHQDGFYNDPKGGAAREGIGTRLRARIHFSNRIKLFPAVHHEKHFEFTIVGREPRNRFVMFGNIFHPLTIDQSFTHDGRGEVPGIKNEQGEWDLRGHRSRGIQVDEARMRLFAQLLDDPGTPPWEARLPVLMSEQLVTVLEKFASQPRRLGDLKGQYLASEMWHETNQQKDGTIRAENRYATRPEELIYQGPHFFVGNPLYQTPNDGCSHNQDYSSIDLESIPADYLPRTNYVPACDAATYLSRTPKWKGRPVTDSFRLVARKMISPTGERTMIPSLLPPGSGHIDGCFSLTMEEDSLLVALAALQSLPADFFTKAMGKSNFRDELASLMPLLDQSPEARRLSGLTLRLNCVTKNFADLWNRHREVANSVTRLSSGDRRLVSLAISEAWSPRVAIRSDFARRMALIEIDARAAHAMAMTLDELLTIYRIQFPVLQQYERDNLYDQHGRLVPTAITANGKGCVSLVALAGILREQAGFDASREYHPGATDTEELLRQPIKLSRRDADVLQVHERCTVADLMATTDVRWSSPEHPQGRPVPLVGLRYTDPALEPRKQRIYPTPWTRQSREADYAQAWTALDSNHA